ncbi:MAG: hemolysin family protein [Acholeplasmataceae bacterium]
MYNSSFIALIILIILSGLFSATETAFSSLNPIKLKFLIEQGNKRASKTLAMYEKFEKLLVVILVGNNIVNILSASLATLIFVDLLGQDLGVTIATVVLTTVVLIFGEITPKSIAKQLPESFAMFITPFIKMVSYIILPITFIFGLIQQGMNRLFKFKKQTVTEDELLTYVAEVEKQGGINANEKELIQRVIDFDALKVTEILTPRVDIQAVDITDDIEDISDIFESTGHSRLPVYDKDLDHIIGILHYKDFIYHVVTGKKTVKQMMKDPIFVTEYMKIVDLLHMLKTKKEHLAIVKDEHGGTQGLASLEDIVEELVGDIFDEHDAVEKDITKIDQDHYIVKGSAELEDVLKLLGFEYDDAQTMNGFMLDQMGKIPFVNESFEYEGFSFKVRKTTKKKILEVEIKKVMHH